MKRRPVTAALALLTTVLTGCSHMESMRTPFGTELAVRVNCGGPTIIDDQGRTWLADSTLAPDMPYTVTGGQTISRPSTMEIANTDTPELYRTERYGNQTYRFTMPRGRYLVRLHFAETFDGITAPGQRVFSVSVNGVTVLEDVDPMARAGGFAKALVVDVDDVKAPEGTITIQFTEKVQNPEINAIEILAD